MRVGEVEGGVTERGGARGVRGAPARSTKPKARLRSANEIVSGGPAPVGVRGSELQLGTGTARLGNQVVEFAAGDGPVVADVDVVELDVGIALAGQAGALTRVVGDLAAVSEAAGVGDAERPGAELPT